LSSITDSIVIALTLYFLYRGWSKGLLRVLAGPIALLVGCLGAYIYYTQEKNIIVAFLISVVAPLILNIVFSLALTVWQKIAKIETPISTASRVWAAGICAIWGDINILLIIVLVVLLPVNIPWVESARKDIFNSATYSLIDQWTRHLIPEKSIDIRTVSKALNDPGAMEHLQSSTEYKAVMEDEAFQQLLADEETMKDIQDKNFAKLLANPKLQAMLKDPEMVKKILDLNVKIMEQKTPPEE